MEGDILLNEQNFILSTISFFKKKMDSISTYCFVGKHDAVNWWFVNLGKYRYWTLGLWIEHFISWGLLYTSTKWSYERLMQYMLTPYSFSRMSWLNLSILSQRRAWHSTFVHEGYTCCLMVWFGETISLTRCCVIVGSTFSLTDAIFGSWNQDKHPLIFSFLYMWQSIVELNLNIDSSSF